MCKPFNFKTMKKILVVIFFLILSDFSQAQWYSKKYRVDDINQLTLLQLDESLKSAKNDVLASGLTAVFGGCLFVLGKYSMLTSDNPSFFEQLVGEKGMNDLWAGVGVGLFAGGAIAFFGYLEREGHIKTAMRQNFPGMGTIHLSPRINLGRFSPSGNFGVTLSCNF